MILCEKRERIGAILGKIPFCRINALFCVVKNMGNKINKEYPAVRKFTGRKMIMTSAKEITPGNIIDELQKAMNKHNFNRSDIEYLWRYYRGDQPILKREKQVRPEICNRIVENRANEIVSFKVGYLCGEPIQYISKDGKEKTTTEITRLNDLMFAEDKAYKDQEIVEWQMICGTAFRMVLPDDVTVTDESPFEIYTLDPRDTFVVYSTDIGHKPLMGVKYYKDDQGIKHYSVYTKDRYYELDDGALGVSKSEPHALGMIPIFEYPANKARLGAFEIVLPLLDAINNIESNRMDGMEQMIQAFIKFINCDIDEEGFQALLDMGAIKVKSTDGQKADVDIVTNDFSQDQSQTFKDDCYQAILTICGIPNRNGGSSTSDTGAAVLLRDGWSLAEARAKDSENIFKKAEKEMLKLVLRICRDSKEDIDLRLTDIDMKFTRRNYENIQSKSQVLVSMLQNDKIHPSLAFTHCGLFSDPESAYALSEQYYKENQMNNSPREGGIEISQGVREERIKTQTTFTEE